MRLGRVRRGPGTRRASVAVAAVAATLTAWNPAAATELETACSADNAVVPRMVECDFRITEPVNPDSIVMTANGETLVEAAFEPFSSSGRASAWLYLIDVSNPARAGTVRENAEFVTSQLALASERRLMGVSTFASQLDSVLPIAAIHHDRDAQMSEIRAEGVATEFFANTLEAIKQLDAAEADRKVLVIMSDGKAEDTAYSLDDVVEAAREADITIIGLGYAETASQTPSLQSIRRLAEETGGTSRDVVAGASLPDRFASTLVRYIENGGAIRAPLADQAGDVLIGLDVTLPSGAVLTASQTVAVSQVAPDVEPVEPTFLSRIYGVFGAQDWAAANPALAVLLLLLPILLVAVIVGLLVSRRRGDGQDMPEPPESTQPIDPIEDETPVTSIVGEAEEAAAAPTRTVSTTKGGAFGYFEVVGNERTRFPIDTQAASIGRHSDNDIQLVNDSVHRHHAHLHVSNEGQATIHDLDTTNGVLVNGQRITTVDLQPGDMIELGEVRLRYMK